MDMAQNMSRKHKDTEAVATTLKNDFARQRWELFHRAIAHAKQSNNDALSDADKRTADDSGPRLAIVR